ncbi:MAG: saccharopine dehydrogenase NADP-binding domain-containing protein [Clostridium sp.]|uniref:saccharopine dehydrogenase NADP-binding domain-containing protein n=1 Tax=Clostridium sp. TaxID=1506 RepID=UPI0025BE0C37|nr:saccharopine dehydrogenase NADP-binding domain-containing protein [Clostridium sp.]MCH3963496.1 saccharopine dehydrogenase NADP-binding domain-containing protein [Clostridium sp.]MCI1714637.1 saccharopine dehydrogenase NADP-binding domain-containing protein [Clostridium sp.]MCI1799174.1 saccharopine dehydrogenase NADP-binding domain-containing protein [Clostridium sp.]MCI1812820.1 saccharopine dehydrogenase NADP-binding domain-containing protein [Clostridium sp.]MCI1869710.1 saccharopine de
MQNRRIGILGYGGNVGRVVVDYLKHRYYLRCGQRNINYIDSSNSNIEYIKIDIYDNYLLKRFCEGCDVIINCIGPSYFVSETIARTALKVSNNYIDIFGVNLLNKEWISGNKKIILGAGSFPGLSGILPNWLINSQFDRIENLYIYAGGKEYISKAACADLLLSIFHNFGKPNFYYSNHKMLNNKYVIDNKVIGFSEDYDLFEYMTKEIFDSANKLNINEFHWYNVQVNKQYRSVLEDAIFKIVKNKTKEEIYRVSEDIIFRMGENNNSRNWYNIYIKSKGLKNEKKKTYNALFECKESNAINGFIASMCAECILKLKSLCGIYWPFQILNSIDVMDKLQKENIIKITQMFHGDIEKNDIEKGTI